MLNFAAIYWDPKPEIFIVPVVQWPILWYGVLFAVAFAFGFPIFVGILTRFLGKNQRSKAIQITDRLSIYMIIATVAGARLGHFIFYEHPSHYLRNPLEIFCVWEGGLASHGAAIAIILALVLFSYRIRSLEPKLTWIHLLDFVAVPTALGGSLIRLGNFINQEILGTPTDLPWGVVFGHPADLSAPLARHPVQLYESFFYLAVFFLLWRLTYNLRILSKPGKLIGLFLMTVFGFRFFIEFLKIEQSHLLEVSPLTMGQLLSIPAVLAGVILYLLPSKES